MLNFTSKFDFRDVNDALAAFEQELKREMEKTGEAAVEYAKEHGTYHDVTGNLRRSNRYYIKGNKDLVLVNDAPYAADVEARGEDVLSSAALFAEQQLRDKCK